MRVYREPEEHVPTRAELRAWLTALRRDGAVRTVDDDVVRVHHLGLVGGSGEQRVEIGYEVPGLVTARTGRHPLPSVELVEDYEADLVEQVGLWASEAARCVRPIVLPERDDLARLLPDRDELWQRLRGLLTDPEDVPPGAAGTVDGRPVTIAVTPEQWHDLVIRAEVGCRRDFGPDADGAGDGPGVALGYVEKLLATLRSDEHWLVRWRGRLHRSVREELPPVRGTGD